MYYYHLVLTIFRPLVASIADLDSPAQKVVDEATRNLLTLIRLYYLRHGFEAMDLFIVIPLMLAASDCITAIHNDTPFAELQVLQSTLILVAKGLHLQRRNHYLAEALFRVVRGRMRPIELTLFRNLTGIDGEQGTEEPDGMQAVMSHWPVSVVTKKDEVDTYVLGNLVESYAHLNVHEAESQGQTVSS